MSVVRGLAICAVVFLMPLAPVAASAQEGFASTGGTQVAVQGKVVTITVTIDLVLGGLGERQVPEGAQEAANSLADEIERYWNEGLARYATDCIEVRLDVVINTVPNAQTHLLNLGGERLTWVTQPGHHVMFWGVDNFGRAAPPETYDEYDDDGISPPGEDYQSPLDHEMWGFWSPQLEDARDFAHEFGHLLGFGDDYAEGGEALPGREGTLMDNGDLIDEPLFDRLAELVRSSGERLPECWEGTITGTSTSRRSPCGVRYEGEITILASGGTATLEGTITATGTGPCSPFETTSSLGSNPGLRTSAGFEFPGLFIARNSVITVSGNHGTGTATGQTADAIFEYRFEIDCVSCPA